MPKFKVVLIIIVVPMVTFLTVSSIAKYLFNQKVEKEFKGIKIPTKGDLTWKLDTGDFNWFNFEVTEIEYNYY